MNPFEFFQIDPEPIIDLVLLRRKYIDLQKSGHPDLGYGDELSEATNRGYTLLKCEETRVGEILKIYGPWPPPVNWIDKEFLMESMELGEEIELLDRSNTIEVSQVSQRITELIQLQQQELAQVQMLWSDIHADDKKPEVLKRLSVWYQKNRYISRLQKNLNQEKEI
jgi:hypothetical protein